MPKPSSPSASNNNSNNENRKPTPSSQVSSSEDGLWDVEEILDEKKDKRGKVKYLLKWAGTDPATGKQWDPSWQDKESCTPALLKDWRAKKALKKAGSAKASPAGGNKKRPTPISIASTPAPSEHNTPQSATLQRPASRLSTATPLQLPEKPETQQLPVKPETQPSSEYIPSQKLLPQRIAFPALRKITPKKRKSLSAFKVVVPSKSGSPPDSKPRSEKRVTPEAAKKNSALEKETPREPIRPVKKRKLIRGVIEDSQPEFPKSIPVVESAPLDASPKPETPVTKPTVKPAVVEPAKPVAPHPPSQPSPKPQPRQEKGSRSRSRSRQVTPSQPLARSRHRSLSPVTKVDSWLSFDSDNNFDEDIPQTEIPPDHLHSGTLSQIHDPPSLEPTADMNPMQPGPSSSSFTPVQATQFRQPTPAQNVSAGQIVQQGRGSGGSSRRSISGSAVSHQSFSSTLALRERLQGTQDSEAYERIRTQASYARKTPTASSILTSASNFSLNTGVSSVSTNNLTNLRLVKLGEGESLLAVSATALQTRLTRGILINRQTQIQEFCSNALDASDELTALMKELVENCSRLATHPYMIITPPLANAELPEEKEAEYLGSSSGKFVALGRILDALSGDKEVRVGVVAEDAKEIDLLEGFLRGRGVRVRRTDSAGVRSAQLVDSRGGANVTLVISGKAGARAMVNRVDIVIAMDLSYNPEDDQILRLRQHPTNIDELSPVIRLVTVNSAEHVRLCLPNPHEIPNDKTVLQGLISATTILRNFNGSDIPDDNDERYVKVAEYIRSRKETDVFGIRDIESYMAGHRGLAGLALKRARDPTDEGQGADRKRLKTHKSTWQQPSFASLQRENDELHETLARKTLLNESLRTDLQALQSKFDVLTIQKNDLSTLFDRSQQDLLTLRTQIANAPTTDPLHLQSELNRLTKALESKTRDFDYTSAQYQDASVKAAESGREVLELRQEVEKLRQQVGKGVKELTWEAERKVLLERCRSLEEKCRVLEERERRREQRATSDGLGGIA